MDTLPVGRQIYVERKESVKERRIKESVEAKEKKVKRKKEGST